MPQPKSSSSRTTAKRAAPKKAAAKPAAKRGATAAKRTTGRATSAAKPAASKRAAPKRAASSAKTTAPRRTAARTKTDDARLSQLREMLGQAVVIPTERLASVLNEARHKGHIDAAGVEAITQNLAKGAEGMRSELEALLGKGVAGVGDAVTKATRGARGAGDDLRRQVGKVRGKGGSFKLTDFDDLSVAQLTKRLSDLTPGQLKKVRDREASKGKRKSVLGAIDKRLR